MKRQPIVALLTDFGTSDGYVAAMKGVILSRCPGAVLVDLSHDVPRHDVRAGAYLLWSVFRDFPRGTIFLAVVDPGVGSARALSCTRVDGYVFLAPDNGLLDLVTDGAKQVRAVELIAARRRREPVSATFHGRDILAPAAAEMCAGTPMRSLGKPRPVARRRAIFLEISARRPGRYHGSILHIDHFGNMITNFSVSTLPSLPMSASLGSRRIRFVATHYADAKPRAPFLMVGSGGLLEIAVRGGSAARATRASIGDPVTLAVGGAS